MARASPGLRGAGPTPSAIFPTVTDCAHRLTPSGPSNRGLLRVFWPGRPAQLGKIGAVVRDLPGRGRNVCHRLRFLPTWGIEGFHRKS